MREHVILSVEGNIGVGKSTFLEVLEAESVAALTYRENNRSYSPPAPMPTPASPITFVPEPVETWQNIGGHNLLEQFYADPKSNSFIFQIAAVSTRVDLLEKCSRSLRGPYILERSIVSDNIFASNCHASGLMTDREYAVYTHSWAALAKRDATKVSGVIYLRASPDTCFARQQKRGRSEEKDIAPKYLVDLHDRHEETFGCTDGKMAGTTTPVLTIDAEQDFRPGTEGSRECALRVWDLIDSLATTTTTPASA